MYPMLTTAVKAARRAGAVINRAARDIEALSITRKRHNDYVTEVDQGAEQAIIEVLQKAYPDHAILAEESGSQGKSDYVWIIDPLDGTTNFIHGFPQYAVSIALQHKACSPRRRLRSGQERTVHCQPRPRRVHERPAHPRLQARAPARRAHRHGISVPRVSGIDEYMAMFREVTTKTAGVRRAGAAALDLAYVAAGRLDGFWRPASRPGHGRGRAAHPGGRRPGRDMEGESDYLESGRIVAGSPKIFAQLLQTLTPHAPQAKRG